MNLDCSYIYYAVECYVFGWFRRLYGIRVAYTTFNTKVGNGTASLLFGSYLGSYSYDRHADKSGRCFGRDCFSFPHLVMAAACALAISECRLRAKLPNQRRFTVQLSLKLKVPRSLWIVSGFVHSSVWQESLPYDTLILKLQLNIFMRSPLPPTI